MKISADIRRVVFGSFIFLFFTSLSFGENAEKTRESNRYSTCKFLASSGHGYNLPLDMEECTRDFLSYSTKYTNMLEEASLDKYRNRIGPSGLWPYTMKGYPETVTKYKTRLKEIEHFRRRTAEMVLDSRKCKFIEFVELSLKSPINNLTFFADCRNGHRVFLNEKEIAKGKKVMTQADRSWNK